MRNALVATGCVAIPSFVMLVISANAQDVAIEVRHADAVAPVANGDDVATNETPPEPESATRAADPADRAETEAPVDAIQGPLAQDLPRVVLADRMPAWWLSDRADARPLEPARWRRRVPRRCRTRGGYRAHCSGDRLVAEPSGEALARAQKLGLGERATARWLLQKRPFPEWVQAVAGIDEDPRLTFPIPDGRIGRGFGRVRDRALRHRPHKGVDIGGIPEGTPIRAVRGGLVAYADNHVTGYGNTLIVLHSDGYSSVYAHCYRILVAAGQYIARGQVVAQVGETGFAYAPHLHFEWRQRGWPRDPRRHFLDMDRAGNRLRRDLREAHAANAEDPEGTP